MRDLARYVSRIACAAVALPAVAFGALAGLASGPSGCSPTSSSPASPPDAEALCPDTLAATIGAACGVEALVCSPQYACGIAPATARCVCTGGTFLCNDVRDAALETPDAAPYCPPRADAEACPALERTALLAPCTETGLVCTYLAPCDATPALDQCQCMEGALGNGSTGRRFQCSSPCTYLGSPVRFEADASDDAPGPLPEAADEGLSEAGPPVDAAAVDGPDDSRAAEASD